MTYDPRAPRPNSRGPRPQIWRTGPDPVLHKKYLIWLQQRNQAQWREEGWTISFEEWLAMWTESGQWDNRGRERGCYCMSRRDWSLPWTVENAHIVTREQHSRMQGQAQRAGWCSIAQKKRRERLNQPRRPRRGSQGELDL
jgi:hypothetical protein